jgi:hypothetical protein
VPQINDLAAQTKERFFQMGNMGLQASHPASRILDVIAILQLLNCAGRRCRSNRAN